MRRDYSSHIASPRLFLSSPISNKNNALQFNLIWTYIRCTHRCQSYLILLLLETILYDCMAPFTLDFFYLILSGILITLLSFIPHSSAAARTRCSELYGHPDGQACRDMLIGDDIIPLDTNSRLYSLGLRRRPRNVSVMQWQQRQELPILRSNGEC